MDLVGIHISCMTVQQPFYLDQNTSDFEKHTEVFDRELEVKFNEMTPGNTKDVAYEDTTDMLDLDFVDKIFEANFNWFIDIDMVLQVDDYYQGERDETNPCIVIELNIRQRNYGDLMHDSLKKRNIYLYDRTICIPSRETQVEHEYSMTDTLSVNILAENLLAPVGLDIRNHMIVDEDIQKCFGP